MTTRQLFLPFLLAVIAQTGHYAEHVAQLIQIYGQHVAPASAHGLLGAVFDFEWVHFTHNVGLEFMLIGLWLAYRQAPRAGFASDSRLGIHLLTGLVVFQGYHSIEHITKLVTVHGICPWKKGKTGVPIKVTKVSKTLRLKSLAVSTTVAKAA